MGSTLSSGGTASMGGMASMGGAPSVGGMAPMGGMEHPQDTLFVPPLVNPRVVSQFSRAILNHADAIGRGAEANERVRDLRTRLDRLRDLAGLCRLAVLGHPGSFERVLDEMSCIAADFPDSPLDPAVGMEAEDEDEPDDRTQFAALIDLLAGAAFVSKDDPAQRDRLVVGIVRAVEDAICYPIAFSGEAAAYVGEGDGELAQAHVALAVASATGRLVEGDKSCDPGVALDIRARLEGLALKWMAANPVDEMFRALTGPRLNRMLRSIDPDDVATGDRVTLTLKADCARTTSQDKAAQGEDLFVLFCPAQLAKVQGWDGDKVKVEVPAGARTGPVALVRKPALEDVQHLLARYACEYPVEWFYSLFSMIPMWKWAYPVAFGRPLVEVTQVPEKARVTVHTSDGPVAGGVVPLNEPVAINYQVDPPGSERTVPLQVTAPSGQVTRTASGTVVYRPTQPGVNVVELRWGSLARNVTISVGGAPPRTKGTGAASGGVRDE